MAWIETFLNNISTPWAILALVAFIGLAVVILRGFVRLAMRAFLIGLVGLIVLGAVYFLL